MAMTTLVQDEATPLPTTQTLPSENHMEAVDNIGSSATKRRKLELNGSITPVTPVQMSPGKPVDVSEQKECNPSAPVTAMLYMPGTALPKLSKFINQIIEVRIASKYISIRNKEVSTRQIWGTDIYTDDSDAVAICQHSGKIMLRPTVPNRMAGISAFFRVLPCSSHYQGSLRYKVRSRNWIPEYHKCSLEMIRIAPILHAEKLDPRSPGNQLKTPKSIVGSAPIRRAYMKRKFDPDVTIIFNCWNEPCLKYYLGLIADRGTDPAQWTSTRLQKETLYLNTDRMRYELSRAGNNGQFDVYKWSRCHEQSALDLKQGSEARNRIDVLEEDIDWEEIEWGVATVWVRGVAYHVKSIQFLPTNA